MSRFDLRLGALRLTFGKLSRPTVFAVRHGQSLSNVDRNVHNELPDPMISLSALGEMQAIQAGYAQADWFDKHGWPKRIRVFHSEYKRARQTSNGLLKALRARAEASGVKCLIDERSDSRIHELEFGWLSGMTEEARNELLKTMGNADVQSRLLRDNGAKFFDRRMGGESPADVDVRLRSFIGALYRDRDENDIPAFIVISHGLTNRVLAKLWLGEDFRWYETQDNPRNCAIRHLTDQRTDGGYIHRGGKSGIGGGTEESPTEGH